MRALSKTFFVIIVAGVVVSVAIVLLAWLSYTPPHSHSPKPSSSPTLDCVPDRLVSGEGITMSYCFALDNQDCKVSEGCALVPKGISL